METRESINNRYREKSSRYFRNAMYGAVLGLVISTAAFVRDYYQTNNIPTVYPPNKSNTAIGLTGSFISFASLFSFMVLDTRARKKRKHELESLSETPQETGFEGLPYSL